MRKCAKAKEGKNGKSTFNKIHVYLNQERWLMFRGLHDNTRDILNFIAERIKLSGTLKMKIDFSGL